MKNSQLLYLKEIVQTASPIVSVRIFYIITNFIGMIFIAHLGKYELAAGALIASLLTTIMVIAMSPLFAISILAGKAFGEKKLPTIGIYLRQSWILCGLLTLFVSLILWILPDFLFRLHQPIQIIPLIKTYFHTMILGIFPAFIMASCYQFLFSTRQGKIVMFWNALTMLFTILLGGAFTFGFMFFPKMSMAGWPIAAAIVNWTMMISVLLYLYKNKIFANFELFKWNNFFSREHFLNLSKTGFSIALQFSGELLAFMVLSLMIGKLGTLALSAQQIILQCAMVTLMIPMGCGQACSILTAHAIGKNEKNAIRGINNAGILLVTVCMVLIVAIYIIKPELIMALFINIHDPSNMMLIKLTTTVFIIAAFSQIIDAVRNVIIGILRGLQDIWYPTNVNVILLWVVGIPLAYLLGFTMRYGLVGIYTAYVIIFSLGSIFMLRRLNFKTEDFLSDKVVNSEEITAAS